MPRQKPGARSSPDASDQAWVCAYDGALLDTVGERAGWCPDARAYALAYRVWLVDDTGTKQEHAREVRCPFACPLCYASLTWDGGCDRCHGSKSQDRTTWTFPGARYELAPDRHYHWVAAGPRPVAPEAEVYAILAGVKRDLARWTAKQAILAAPVHPAELPAWVTSLPDDPEAVPF